MNSFTHLHVHSEYSLLDGSAKITELVSRAHDLGMTSLALTDHGVMYGIIDFYKAAKAQGIKPILGCEVYVSVGSRHEKTTGAKGKDKNYTHLVLLAENEQGYHNLIKLVSLGFKEGFYYKPRVDIELLQQYHSGLIALSGCLAGSVSRAIMQGDFKKAKEEALLFDGIFGRGNFFLELQDHGLNEQKSVNNAILNLREELKIPLVVTNDVHYIRQEDFQAHDVLLCIQTNKTIHDEDRLRYGGDQFYLKSPKEMYSLFSYAQEPSYIQDALENTQKIADRCHVEIEFNQYKLPKYPISEIQKQVIDKSINDQSKAIDPFYYLQFLCENGLKERYGQNAHLHQKRLQFELDTISNMGFVDYFLIVWDFIKYARDNGIIVGPGRGSAAGSIVAYSLKITDVDPIKFGLMFERFLNPERISMPDIDIDFCYERRQEVIDYVVRKYGAEQVAQIITFGTMAAKGAIRDVGRALAMPYADVDRIAKMIPFELGITISRSLEINPELKKAYAQENDTSQLIDMSLRLEGLTRHASTHAAGVIICDGPVDNYVPLYQADDLITTQFSMNTLEELGLLKMDFLGLRTLTVIQNAVNEIERTHNIIIDWQQIGYDDPKVFQLIAQGKTEGIFQLESSGMKSFIKELQPESLEDIIAGIALYRPGPMDFIPKYVKGKHSGGDITYTHPALEPILSMTYGCIVYQEQVMQIVRELAGYSLARSDLVRRAMSKKKADVMAQERKHFIQGCVERNIPEQAANQIFDEMSDFAKYAFNKSHAAAYAVIGYQTAWLKQYYPVEFMAATMTSVMGSTSNVVAYIQVCKKMGISLLPPDINEGFGHFSVSASDSAEKNNGIRFGLSAIKNVGKSAIDLLVAEREANGQYIGLTDFIRRMGDNVNKRFVEGLIKAGAFDSLRGKRSQYMAIHKNVIDGIAHARKRTAEGQLNLFEMAGQETHTDTDELPNIKELDARTLLNDEKEVLGLYVSGHPLSAYGDVLNKYADTTSISLASANSMQNDRQRAVYGGMITARTVKYTRSSQKPMAFITVEDLYGSLEVIVFSQLYERYGTRLQPDQVIIIEGQLSCREDEEAKLIADNIKFYEDLVSKTFWVKIPKNHFDTLQMVTNILQSHPGNTQVKIYDEGKQKKFVYEKGVTPSLDLFSRLENLLGSDTVKLV
ncbi:MAG: DNA polymerase III subunit alpha [Defluviitaleaceae bacterium]|nr:DNA polymerase III subunit alpha [Defluviitaleaceae bacterium]